MRKITGKAERQAWWASLSPEEQAAYIERKNAAKADRPSGDAAQASARLDLANERGCFMSDVPDADVKARLQEEGRS